MLDISEEKSVEILINIFKAAGLMFRKVNPGEEGGFFYTENGVRKKFVGNIFVKRSLNVEKESSDGAGDDGHT